MKINNAFVVLPYNSKKISDKYLVSTRFGRWPLLDLWDYNSVFSPWSGTCPVLNYHQEGTPVVKIAQTPKYKIHNFQFEYIFKTIVENKEGAYIFNRWIEN